MANELAKTSARAADSLVGKTQAYAIPDKTIQDNLHLLRYTLQRLNSNDDKGGAVVNLDQSKVFDRFDHRYLVSALAQFCLGFDFLRWIIQLYSNIDFIRMNGFLSKPFYIICLVH